MTNWIGHHLGHYRLERLLGSGGFAEVYLGVHVHLESLAAIKLLHAQFATASELEQFRTEAQTIASLHHPHIVRLLDFGVEEGTPYLVVDYAPHGSLRQRFPLGTRLSPATILPVLVQVASALQYAHEQQVIHRDVKPENLLLGRNQEVLLTDFGIATVAQNTSQQRTQGVAGTAAYMAPEQLQGKPRPASDLYALGVVVYEWLCGERPFQGGPLEVATQHLLLPPPPLREKVPTILPAIEQVVLAALAKDPKERFGSVRAFATAFRQACGEAGSAYLLSTQAILPPASAHAQPAAFSQASTVLSPTPAQAGAFDALLDATTLPSPTPPVSPKSASDASEARGVDLSSDLPTQHSEAASARGAPALSEVSLPPAPLFTPPPKPRPRGLTAIISAVLVLVLLGASCTALGLGRVGPLAWAFGAKTTPAHGGSSNTTAPATATQIPNVLPTPSPTLSPTPSLPPGSVWTTQNSGTGQDLSEVTWSGSLLVAVGSGGTILTATNANTWTAQNSGTSQNLSGVTWSGTQFVAVGDAGTILTSPNGRTWTAHNFPTIARLFSVASSGSQYVIVGSGGDSAGNILSSPDGFTWTPRNSGTSEWLYGVIWAGTQFVAMGAAARGRGTIDTSPDGRTWTVQNSGTSQWLNKVAWSEALLVAVGYAGTILTSSNGSAWTVQSSGSSHYLLAAAWSGAQFVVVGAGGTILTSATGSAWTAQNSATTLDLLGVTWTGRHLVVVGKGGTILTSP